MTSLNERIDFVALIDVRNGNPNGDPDAGNAPRAIPSSGHGLITDVCLKRKVRNYIGQTQAGRDGHAIYVSEGAVLQNKKRAAYEEAGLKPDAKRGGNDIATVRDIMCRHYWDVRAFGAVMSLKVNAGTVRGPVQIEMATSIDPIDPVEVAITRMAVETEVEAAAQNDANRTMGRKWIVPYGLYRFHGAINVFEAQKHGFTADDLMLFREALTNMFEHDMSAARGIMCVQRVIAFNHGNELGRAQRGKLFRRVSVQRKDPLVAASCFDDYEVLLDSDGLPHGMTIEEWV